MKSNPNDAILMALLQDIRGQKPVGGATSTAAIAMANIKRDGATQEDVHEIAANDMFDQSGDIVSKIKLQFQQHPEILKELQDFADKNNMPMDSSLESLANLIEAKLSTKKYMEGGQIDNSSEIIDVTINEKVYHLLHLVSEEEKENGLMEITSLLDDEGALFDYSDSPEPELSFWMKDTHIPLLICFINEEGKVISTHKGIPDTEDLITESSEFIAYVIEVNEGENINPGDQTSLGTEEEPDDFNAYPELKVNKLVIYGSDGQPQGYLQGGERIFSRIATRKIIAKAKKAYSTKDDKDYKALGRFIFKEMHAQDNRSPEYIEN